jgi:hypothetical protein
VKREFLKLLDLYILIVLFKSETFKELLTTQFDTPFASRKSAHLKLKFHRATFWNPAHPHPTFNKFIFSTTELVNHTVAE